MKYNLLIYLFALGLLTNTSCANKPTYPKENFEEALTSLCKREYNLDVVVKVAGSTLGVYLPLGYMLNDAGGFSDNILKDIEGAMLCIHRAVTSTDKELEFYKFVAADVQLTGTQFILIGNVTDIRRVRAWYISRGEYFKRTLRSIEINLNAIGDKEGRNFHLEDIRMQDFLVQQMAKRIQEKFEEEELSLRIEVSRAHGVFIDEAERRYFNFEIDLLDKRDKWIEQEEESEPAWRIVHREALNVISAVIDGYKFEEFNYISIKLSDEITPLIISKENLELFRTQKIGLNEIIAGQI